MKFHYNRNSKSKKEDRCRECRNGCGVEVTAGKGDTPGFHQYKFDTIEEDNARKIMFLRLKRDENKMKQTSISMLQSWRANCDVAIIVYDNDPVQVNAGDIARISGYVVSYATKGNKSYQSERDSIAALIENAGTDFAGDEKGEVLRLSRKIMNMFITSRVVSKAEASVELLSLDLYWCTESMRHVNLSSFRRLKDKSESGSDNVAVYACRKKRVNVSMNDFLTDLSAKKKLKIPLELSDFYRIRPLQPELRPEIIIPTGLNGNPVFPVSSSYARTVLLLHKPWSQSRPLSFESGGSATLFPEFYEFLKSDLCPINVRLGYASAKEKYDRGLRFLEVTNDTQISPSDDEHRVDDPDFVMYVDALRNVRNFKGMEDFYKGTDGFDFSVKNSDMDPNNQNGNWLLNEKSKWQDNAVKKKSLTINKRTGKPYSVSDLGDNKEQQEIFFAVVKTLKEWLEWPEKHKKDKNADFTPLCMTVQGAGGTGKSHVIHIITNAIESIFPVKVTQTCAPTGCAAYSIGGKTVHSFFKISVKDAGTELSPAKEQQMKEDILRLLCLIIDERSLLSMDALGAAERNCTMNAHGGVNRNKDWGGIPIVLLFGDDYQLPAVVIDRKGYGATRVIGDDGMLNMALNTIQKAGRNVFLRLASVVHKLTRSQRIQSGDVQLQTFCDAIRYNGGLNEDQAEELLRLKINHPGISDAKRQELLHEAMWIFTTNAEAKEHNKRMMTHHVHKTNPLMNFGYKLVPSANSKKDRGFFSHFAIKTRNSASVPLCRGARICLDRNIWTEAGLYNGAMGTVIDIRFAPGESPLQGHLPIYVIVKMDEYVGPIWDEKNPCHVPIPPMKCPCEKFCCEMEQVPVQLSFARTLHRFQGVSVGPGHAIPCMVLDPGRTGFEGNNPGILYTGISRATTLGNGCVNDSAFYLAGPNATKDRLTNLTQLRAKGRKKVTYLAVLRRQKWLDYLSEAQFQTQSLPTADPAALKRWLKTNKQISLTELDDVIQYHNMNRK